MKNFIIPLSTLLLLSCTGKSQEPSVFKELFDLNINHTEISGMIYQNGTGNLWMLEDKGNAPELYVYSVEGEFLRTVTIKDQQNTDWEDLSTDTQGNLYIGNFGNNKNERQDLAILKIDESSLAENEVSPTQITKFSYEDQTDFPPKKSELKFDSEAFVATAAYFYIFTKNRSKGYDGSFSVYKVPNRGGEFVAKKVATLESCSNYKNCAITGASISKDESKIVLLTHDKVFALDFSNDASFQQEHLKAFELGHHSQKEAVAFKNNSELYIADEKDKNGGKVYYFTLD